MMDDLMSLRFEVTYRRPAPLQITDHRVSHETSDARLIAVTQAILGEYGDTRTVQIPVQRSRTHSAWGQTTSVDQTGWRDGEPVAEYQVELVPTPLAADGVHRWSDACTCEHPVSDHANGWCVLDAEAVASTVDA